MEQVKVKATKPNCECCDAPLKTTAFVFMTHEFCSKTCVNKFNRGEDCGNE